MMNGERARNIKGLAICITWTELGIVLLLWGLMALVGILKAQFVFSVLLGTFVFASWTVVMRMTETYFERKSEND